MNQDGSIQSSIDDLLDRHVPGLKARDHALFASALTHRSAKRATNYERLEFLGDSVLGLIVTDYLFQRYPEAREGFLTTLRTRLVNGAMLARLFAHTGLAAHVRHASIESANLGRAVQEDCFEAFLGALYLDNDGDLGIVRRWLVDFLEEHVDFSEIVSINNNHRDAFVREYSKRFNQVPVFSDEEIKKRPDGKPVYVAVARTKEGVVLARGTGASRKAAQNDAAKRALDRVRTQFYG